MIITAARRLALCLAISAGLATTVALRPGLAQETMRPVGTVKSVEGEVVTLTTDAGHEIKVLVPETARVLRAAPGQKDLKDAQPIPLSEIQAGDRMLVRGKAADAPNTVSTISAVVMKRGDIVQRQQQEKQDWQRRGVGGLVGATDPAAGTITISTLAMGGKKNLTVRVGKDTIIRRYAPDSVKFDDAKPGALEQVQPGDQLRARGNRNPEGTEVVAEEIVSGSFRNIAGTVRDKDTARNTLVVMDLATRKPVTIKITADSEMKQLPQMIAQRIAMRLKGTGGAAAEAGRPFRPEGDEASRPNRAEGMRPGGGDLQQILSRMPAVALGNLQKGDAVMIVTTPGSTEVTAITLLSGVEPILTASPNGSGAMLLSPWNLGASVGDALAQ